MIEAFGRSPLAEMDLSEGNFRLLLRKESAHGRVVQIHPLTPGDTAALAAVAAASVHGDLPQAHSAPAQAVSPPAAVPPAGSAAQAASGETINSPLTGTFYPAPTPDAPPFVQPGARVKAGDKLCILEAMKMMNNLEAEFDCEIVSVLVQGGQLVEQGQAIFEVRRV